MAVQQSDGGATPHATDYIDLLAKLKTFITANGWTSVATTSDAEYFAGSGGGSDEIYVGIQKFADVPNDNFAWILQGLTGYVTGVGFHDQPGAIPSNPPALPLWNSPIPYIFVCNSRRFIVMAKVSSLYMTMYAGWILPYAVPAQWPYPLVIGGCTYAQSTNSLIPFRYSTVTQDMSVFLIPQNTTPGTLCVRTPDGNWQRPLNRPGQETVIYNYFDGEGVWPHSNQFQDGFSSWAEQEKTLDGQYALEPQIIHQETPRNCYGEFDGLFHVAGRGQAVENVITRAGVNHFVAQNVFRTAKDAYFAIKLQ